MQSHEVEGAGPPGAPSGMNGGPPATPVCLPVDGAGGGAHVVERWNLGGLNLGVWRTGTLPGCLSRNPSLVQCLEVNLSSSLG